MAKHPRADAESEQPDGRVGGGQGNSEVAHLLLAVRTGRFDSAMQGSADRLRHTLRSRPTKLSQIEELRARSLVCEVYDYFCRYQDARDIVEGPAKKALKDWTRRAARDEPKIFEQEIQIVLHFADCQYRLNDWVGAEVNLERCYESAKRLDQVFGGSSFDDSTRQMAVEDLLGRIAFSKGRLARQSGQYEQSESYFGESTKHILARLEAATFSADKRALAQEYCYARLNCAVSLSLGLSWMLVHKGQLREAQWLVTSARILFEGTEDDLHKAFCEMILGAIERSAAGTDRVLIETAIVRLVKAKKVFDEFEHRRYGGVAAYYLATAYLQAGQLKKAEESAREIAALREGDNRWEVFSRVVLSRVFREMGRLEEAKALARQAKILAESGPHVDSEVDAIVALGEAEERGGNREEAQRHFERALRKSLTMANPKWTGACYLHLVSTHVGQGNRVEAMKYLKLWDQLAVHTQNGYLHSLAQTLKHKIRDLDNDFYLTRDLGEDELALDQHTRALQDFLARLAVNRSGGDMSKAARLLNVSRPTLYSIVNPAKYKKKRRNTASIE